MNRKKASVQNSGFHCRPSIKWQKFYLKWSTRFAVKHAKKIITISEFSKKEIIKLVTKIESTRNKLCYGKRVHEEELEELVKDFTVLKKIFLEVTNYEL